MAVHHTCVLGLLASALLVTPARAGECPADVNGSGSVDVDDLLVIILEWGQPTPEADVTGDGAVNVDDLIAVIQGWGACPIEAAVYVDDDAPPGGDGLSWPTALAHLQDALALAPTAGIDQVRVAAGTYRPDRSADVPEGTGDREATFALVNGVRVLGGYAGFGGDDPNERDPERFETVLTGDLLGDDGPPSTFIGMDENAYRVVTGSGADATAVLEGVTITAGNASEPFPSTNRRGGGVYIEDGAPMLVDCVIRHNLAAFGAGLANIGGAPTIRGCHFIGNRGTMAGGAMTNQNGSPVLTGCSFSVNTASNGGAIHCRDDDGAASLLRLVDCSLSGNGCPEPGFGGGAIFVDSIFATSPARLELARCVVTDNTCDAAGGAIFVRGAHVSLVDCVLARNTGNAGGMMYVQFAADFATSALLDACTIVDNTGGWIGGAVYAVYPDEGPWPGPVLSNCLLWGNAPGVLADGGGGTTEARYCLIEGGYPGEGNLDADPRLRDRAGGDYRLLPDSPCIDAGSLAALPADTMDLDDDGDVDEPLPVDAAGDPRVVGPSVDLGAFELNETVLTGAAAGDLFGFALATVDDLDGDGVADLVIGAPGRDGQRGAVSAHSGASGALLWDVEGQEIGALLGRSVAAAGDVDGDEVGDVLVGAPLSGGTGAVVILSGADGSELDSRSGVSAGDRFGWSVAGDLDIDDDGDGEVLVGAPLRGNTGRLYVLEAATLNTVQVLSGDGVGERFGWSCAKLGRVDGVDGDDFVVGAPRNDDQAPDAGKIYVYSGDLSVLYRRRGNQADERLGTAVAAVGRVDGDNRIDIAVGAPLRDGDAGVDEGRVVVYSGRFGDGLLGLFGPAGSLLGQSVAAAGDVNDDGVDDVLAGAPGYVVDDMTVGLARVLSGANGIVLDQFEGSWPGGAFGRALIAIAGGAPGGGTRIAVGAPDGGGGGAGEVRLIDLD